MIHKNVNYGNVTNVTVVEFGNGTIGISNAFNDNSKSIVMKTAEPQPIGSDRQAHLNTDEFEPEVVLFFRSKESFDVFFNVVSKIKAEYEQSNSTNTLRG